MKFLKTGAFVAAFFVLAVAGFKIVSAQVIPTITVISPNGGESFTVGQTVPILFSTTLQDKDTSGITFQLYSGIPGTAGASFMQTIVTNWIGGSPYQWTIPTDLPSGQYAVYASALTPNINSPEGGIYDASNGTFTITKNPIAVHVSDGVQYGADKSTAFITTSIGAGSQNSQVTSWRLGINCPSGVTLVVPSKNGGGGTNYCGTTQTYDTSNMYDVTRGYDLMNAGATNTNNSPSSVSYSLAAYDSNGNLLGTSQDSVSLAAAAPTTVTNNSDSAPTISYLNPISGTGNTPVVIYGTYLTGATAVNFYNANNQVSMSIPQQNISVTSNGSSLSFVIDNVANGMLAAGTYQVKVVTSAGTSNGANFSFTPMAAPTTPVVCPEPVPYCPYGSYSVAQSNGCPETVCNSAPSTTGSQPVTVQPPATGSGSSSSSMQALQQELVQLMTLLLQLLEKASAQGILSPAQLNSALNSVSH